MGAAIAADDKIFQETLEKEDGIVLVDFWAAWCGPCKAFAPVFEQAAEKNPDVTFLKVDTEANQGLAGALQIQAIPTLMIFRDGILLFRESGALPPAALADVIEQAKKLDMDEVRQKIAEHEKEHEHGPDCNH